MKSKAHTCKDERRPGHPGRRSVPTSGRRLFEVVFEVLTNVRGAQAAQRF
jgi:hypothetical protein